MQLILTLLATRLSRPPTHCYVLFLVVRGLLIPPSGSPVPEMTCLMCWMRCYVLHTHSFISLYCAVFDCLCLFAVCFQIDEDIEGAINFLAQTGPFSVPVRCFKKRCLVIFPSVKFINWIELAYLFVSFCILIFLPLFFLFISLFLN